METLIIPGIFSGSIWQIIGGTSAFGLFILLVLAFMSIVSWVVIFHKWRQFKEVDAANHRFLTFFRRTSKLAESVGQAKNNRAAPVSTIYLDGYQTLTQLAQRKNEGGGLQQSISPLDRSDFEIIEMSMGRIVTEELSRLEKKVIFLATTANAAPFLGLLGTVVGIMDSFWSIGEKGSASLAVVAPGIAEALLATIVGLGAAIPAVIAFNWANSKMKNMYDQSESFILEFMVQARKEGL